MSNLADDLARTERVINNLLVSGRSSETILAILIERRERLRRELWESRTHITVIWDGKKC